MAFDDFVLRERIGVGAFGVVYRAYQTSLDREVALKVAHPEVAGIDGYLDRFHTEARLVARIEHPHVVPVYEYGVDEQRPYLVMRLMESGTLADALQRGPFRVDAAIQMMIQVASGLGLAHRRGLVHADVKPSNILFDRTGDAYLADFGIAIDTFSPTAREAAGTPAYMAPEQIRGEILDERTDIYALGIVLAQTLLGVHPPLRGPRRHSHDPSPPRHPDRHHPPTRWLPSLPPPPPKNPTTATPTPTPSPAPSEPPQK